MNDELRRKIDMALNQAQENGIEKVDLFLGPAQYSEIKPEIRMENGKEFWGGLRVRKLLEEEVRVGVSTCPYGPGVT